MTYLLDTNVWVALLRKSSAEAATRKFLDEPGERKIRGTTDFDIISSFVISSFVISSFVIRQRLRGST